MTVSTLTSFREILFIDAAVADADALLAGFSPDIEVIRLEAGEDGLTQIARVLDGRSGIDAVHVISHGSAGALFLGSGVVSEATLGASADALATISGALSDNADLLLYGCDVAAGAAGESFIAALAAATGADVAASTDATGAAGRGGDWVLEAQTGAIEAATLSAEAYAQLLVANDFVAGTDAASLANHLLAGSDVTIVDGTAALSGPLSATSTFSALSAGTLPGGDDLVLGQGIFLSSGDGTPNADDPSLDEFPLGNQGDAGLEGILTAAGYSTTVEDTSSLSFSFTVPEGASSVLLDFIFASQEYFDDGYDIAGIFIDGVNYAFAPNGSILHVDSAASLESYASAPLPGWETFAARQTLVVQLDPNLATHTFRVAVADTDDGIVASGIFVANVQANFAPVITSTPLIAYTDTAADDSFAAQVYAATATDADGDPLTWAIQNGSDTVTSLAGSYGTLTVSGSDFTYTPADAAIEALKSGATDVFTVHVSDGFETTTQTLTVNLSGADDPTVFAGAIAGALTEDSATTTTGGTLSVADPDTGDAAITPQSGTVGTYGSFSIAGTGVWTYTLNNADADTDALTALASVTETFTVATAGGGSQAITVTITGANDAPVALDGTAAAAEDGAPISGTVGATDVDSPLPTLFALQSDVGAGALSFNADGSWSFAPGADFQALSEAATQDVTFGFTASDSDGAVSAPGSVTITLTGVNDAPVVETNILYQDANEDEAFSFTVPAGTFTDIDSDDVLTYTATLSEVDIDGNFLPLPAWLSFDGATAQFSGTPTQDDVGVYFIRVEADDGHGGSIYDFFQLTVADTNDLPVYSGGPIAGQLATEDEAFSLTLAPFTDADVGASVTYSATLADGSDLPGWLSFDAGTRTFSGTPQNGDGGAALSVRMIATDDTGASSSVDFALEVDHANDAPTGSPQITGTATEDQTLTAGPGDLADIDGLGSIFYQWQRSDGAGGWNGIDGGEGSSYTLTDADVGREVRVLAQYLDDQGTFETVASAPTAPVANVNDDPLGSVTISGLAEEDQELSANAALSDADGLGAIGYQWQRSDGEGGFVDIDGATAATYTLGDADVEAQIRVKASYVDGQGTPETVYSAATLAVANINDAPVGAVTLSGLAEEDQTLGVSDNLSDADGLGPISYQWQMSDGGEGGWVDIEGASGASYTLDQDDVGHSLRVAASYTDGHGQLETVYSDPSAPVANVGHDPLGSVAISGTPTEDQTLTASDDLTDADGLGAITYQWQVDGGQGGWIDIAGASGNTLVLGDDEAGRNVRVEARYTDGEGTYTAVASSSVAVTNVNDSPTGEPVITGLAIEDGTLSAGAGSLADADGLGTISYQWQMSDGGEGGWVDVAGATGSDFSPGDGEVGHTLRVMATYVDGQGTAETVYSSATALVQNVNDLPTGSVAIDDSTPTEDSPLLASDTLGDADGLGTVTYQWQMSDGGEGGWIDIAGATGSEFTPGDAEVGRQLRVEATYTDDQGTDETVDSLPTAAVANVNDAPTVAAPIADQSATEDSAFAYAFAAGTFGDVDPGATLSYSATLDDGSALPSWLSFDAATRSFTGTPNNSHVGALDIKVTATDDVGASVSDTFRLTVVNTNDAPVLVRTIPDTTIAEGTVYSYTVPDGASTRIFNDVDVGDTLNYSASRADGSPLPSWLSFDAATRTFSGTPDDDADIGANDIRVTVTDSAGVSTFDVFKITVTNVNDAPTGAVTIEGTVAEGNTLTANATTLADDDGLGTLSYQWQIGSDAGGWSDISGATTTTLDLTKPMAGEQIRVLVSYTDARGANEVVNSAATAPVALVNSLPTGSVTISGTPTEDQTLTASDTLADADGLGVIGYQWQVSDGAGGWIDIAGATGSTLVLGDAQAGQSIRVEARYVDDEGNYTAVASDNVSVANVNDDPVGSLSIVGLAEEDQELSANAAFSDADGLGAIGYQWQRSDGEGGFVDIDGATGATYSLGDADVEAQIRVKASYVDGQGTPETVYSAATLAVANVNDAPVGAVTLSGLAEEDQTLGVSDSLSDADGLGPISYQWQMSDGEGGWIDIEGASGASYTLDQDDVGHSLRVAASYTDGHGQLETVYSDPSAPVANVSHGPLGSVTISGTPTEDQTLTASDDLTDADGLGAITYQWQASDGAGGWADISGATGSTLLLGDAQGGRTLRVEARYTDGEGTDTAVASDSVAVANLNDAPTVDNVLVDQVALEDSPFAYDIQNSLAPTFGDADLPVGDSLVFSATLNNGAPLPSWLSIDPVTGLLSGTPENSDIGSLNVKVTAIDAAGAAVYDFVRITVANVNDAPTVANPITDQAATEDAAFSFTVPADTFADVDVGDSLSYAATLGDGSPLPAWLSFDPATRIFSGTPGNDDVGTLSVKVTALDGSDAAAEESFDIVVANVNDAPTVAAVSVGADEDGATVDGSFAGSDPDAGDTAGLTYTIVDDVAGGDVFNNGDGTFTFDPWEDFQELGAGESRDVTFTYRATDAQGAESGLATVTVTVNGVNDGPIANDDDLAASADAALTISVGAPGSTSAAVAGESGADLAEGVDTTGTLSVGQAVTGSIEVLGDRDWYAVSLVGGVTYVIEQKGSATNSGSLEDSYVYLYDAAGDLLAENDDSGVYFNSALTYRPETSGTYYVAAGAYHDSDSGTYTLSVQQGSGLLSNDIDAEGDALLLTEFDALSAEGATIIQDQDGNLVYDPGTLFGALGEGQTATDTFFYTVSDGVATDAGEVTITVTGVNDAPTGQVVVSGATGGNAPEGLPLTADTSALADLDGLVGVSYAYEWQRSTDGGASWSAISGATDAGFTPDDTMGGSSLRVVVSYTDEALGLNAIASEAIALINVRDTISGTAGADSLVGSAVIDTIYGLGGNDTLRGGLGNDSLDGETGDDLLFGDAGADTMSGGDGNDLYYVDDAGDVVVETNADLASGGIDTVRTYVDHTLGANVENLRILAGGAINGSGNTLNNGLLAGDGDNVLDGGAGFDMVSYLYAGAGVTVSLATVGSQATGGSGSDTLLSIENLVGSNFADSLSGDGGNNNLSGGAGDDTLDGGAGGDTLVGGSGNDTYLVDSSLDRTTETSALAGEIDSVRSAVSWTLGANLENLILSGSAAINATGNTLANSLTGNAAANVLNGGAGADAMVGGDGNDLYVVDDAGDVVSETNAVLATGGSDTVSTYVNYTLGSNVESLRILATGAVNGSGNALNNAVFAGAGDNVIDGGAGFDTASYLFAGAGVSVSLAVSGAQATGGSGSDTLLGIENLVGSNFADNLSGDGGSNYLSGGTGADTLVGGGGNDTYVVDSVLDLTTETSTLASEIDTVQSAVSWTLGANFENLVLTGSAAISGSGNTLANKLTGNSAANSLNGGAGADTMAGGDGNDLYVVDDAGDVVSETNAVLATGGTDTVSTYVSYTLGANVESLRILAAGAADGSGNTLNNALFAGAGDNVLDGGAGYDTASYLFAGAGVSVSLAVSGVQATGGSGADTLVSIENLAGSNFNDSLSGDGTANSLLGGSGDDLLAGGLGNDALTGGVGADSFRFDTAPNAASNRDTVVDFSVADDTLELENGVFTALTATGTLAAGSLRSGAGITTAADADDYLIYNSTSGALYYDADGSGSGAAAVQFATLSSGLALSSSDFLVI